MASFNDNYEKGNVLMQQALKKYAEGDYEGGDKDRKEANRYFDKASSEINSEDGQMTQLYGESRNFGIIYNVFEQNIDKLFESEKGKKVMRDAYKLIKNDKILNEQFKSYDIIEKANNVSNVKSYVNEAVELIGGRLSKNDVKASNEKFIKFIKANKLDEYVEIPEETEKLYEAIEYVMLNKKNFNNLTKFVNAQDVITEHIEKNNNIKPNTEKHTFENFKTNVDELQEKYDKELNDEEVKLLETFTNSKNTKQLFEEYKKQTLDKLKNVMINEGEGDNAAQWKSAYKKVEEKQWSENLMENIVNCAEMLEVCSVIDEE